MELPILILPISELIQKLLCPQGYSSCVSLRWLVGYCTHLLRVREPRLPRSILGHARCLRRQRSTGLPHRDMTSRICSLFGAVGSAVDTRSSVGLRCFYRISHISYGKVDSGRVVVMGACFLWKCSFTIHEGLHVRLGNCLGHARA